MFAQRMRRKGSEEDSRIFQENLFQMYEQQYEDFNKFWEKDTDIDLLWFVFVLCVCVSGDDL